MKILPASVSRGDWVLNECDFGVNYLGKAHSLKLIS